MSKAKSENLWLLPDGFADVLPNDAWLIENTRQRLLKSLYLRGYELVIPPMAEFLDSLLTGTGTNLELDTFKITDRISGRMMGVRADFTPQISRIDAHVLNSDGPMRLCYVGKCLRTNCEVLQSREPIIIGAELFGAQGAEADREIITLMVDCLSDSGVCDFDLSLGHVGVLECLGRQYDVEIDNGLLDILHRKDDEGLRNLGLAPNAESAFRDLMAMIGGRSILEKARERFGDNAEIANIINTIEELSEQLRSHYPQMPIHFDFSEARGYSYHNGIVFSTLHRTHLVELGRGGRYDNVGALFGRARSATGFSMDLSMLHSVAQANPTVEGVVLAPNIDDAQLDAEIRSLRQRGTRVIKLLNEENAPNHVEVSGRLEKNGDKWRVAKS